MAMMVSSAASPRALQRSRRRRRPAAARTPAPVPTPKPGPRALATAAPAPTPPATAAAPAAAPPPATPPAAAAPAPPELVSSPEYASVDLAAIVGDIAGGTTGEFVSPHVKGIVDQFLDPARHPWLGSEYGAVVPGKVAGVATGQVTGLVGSVVTDALRGVLHGNLDGVGEPKPGFGWEPTPPNKLIAGLVKGISTSWMNIALTQALAPPPPPPPPVYPPDVQPLPPAPVPAPPPPKEVLGKPIHPILNAAAMGIVGTAISAIYDQTVGPLVQRAANVVTGRADEEVKPPAPLTPGRLASGFVDSVLSALLVRRVAFPDGPPGSTTPFAGALGASITNGIIGAAWSTMYGRGVGPAIENGVNQLAGVRSSEDIAKAKLPALEHFTRAATRGVAVGATTYLLGNALTSTMAQIGNALGGVGGALVAVAGAALIGAIGGTAVDATIGPMLGKLGGQVYSWISGKPAYERRMQEAAKQPAPGPTPGDPVKAPNGNPGTVPAPAAGAAPAGPALPAEAAPAAGRAKKRRRTGSAAVDRTAPAINVPNAKLVAIAARG